MVIDRWVDEPLVSGFSHTHISPRNDLRHSFTVKKYLLLIHFYRCFVITERPLEEIEQNFRGFREFTFIFSYENENTNCLYQL